MLLCKVFFILCFKCLKKKCFSLKNELKNQTFHTFRFNKSNFNIISWIKAVTSQKRLTLKLVSMSGEELYLPPPLPPAQLWWTVIEIRSKSQTVIVKLYIQNCLEKCLHQLFSRCLRWAQWPDSCFMDSDVSSFSFLTSLQPWQLCQSTSEALPTEQEKFSLQHDIILNTFLWLTVFPSWLAHFFFHTRGKAEPWTPGSPSVT